MKYLSKLIAVNAFCIKAKAEFFYFWMVQASREFSSVISPPATEAGSRPGRRGTFFCFAKRQVPKEKATRLSASLRFAPGKPASRNSVCGAAQLTARLQRYAQTNGGKSDHEALALFGANARSLNRVPQAQPDGQMRAACEICDEIGLKSRH